MANVRKLMARLNASTCRFDIGRGGIPDLTPQDIAAALGMVADEFAREVFCSVWWPDGARLTIDRLLKMLAIRQRQEIDRQWRAVQIARLELHIGTDELAARRSVSDEDRREHERLKRRFEAARRACWPLDATMYHVIREAALDELAAPNLCRTCNGIGAIQADALTIECAGCSGRGTVAVSDRKRAERIGKWIKSYADHWRAPYEWTFGILRDAEASAGVAISAALAREVA